MVNIITAQTYFRFKRMENFLMKLSRKIWHVNFIYCSLLTHHLFLNNYYNIGYGIVTSKYINFYSNLSSINIKLFLQAGGLLVCQQGDGLSTIVERKTTCFCDPSFLLSSLLSIVIGRGAFKNVLWQSQLLAWIPIPYSANLMSRK